MAFTSIRYVLGAILVAPLLPVMYLQGKKIRKSIPSLPEAKHPSGFFNTGEPKRTPLHIIGLGESTIAGVGISVHEEGLTATFAKTLSDIWKEPVSWKVFARSGYTAEQVLNRLVPKMNEEHADAILIGLGGNDAFTLNRPWRWKKSIEQLIQTLKAKFPHAQIVFANMPPIKVFPAFTPLIKFIIGNQVELLGEELKKVADRHDRVTYFDERLTLQKWMNILDNGATESDFFSDGVHPSKLTYQTWAADMASAWIEQRGSIPIQGIHPSDQS